MNYTELQTAIAQDSHRDDLTALIPRFIRECEGMIRRELVATSITATLDEDDRSADGIYNLPSGLQQIRDISRTTYNNRSVSLDKRSLSQLRSLPSTADPYWYAERGTSQVEFRGVPGTDVEFTLEYIGHPDALVNDEDTNDLLTNHEALYVEGSLFYLYKHTQDLELAQGALDTFTDVLRKLNEQYARKHGGASIAGRYNLFGGRSSY